MLEALSKTQVPTGASLGPSATPELHVVTPVAAKAPTDSLSSGQRQWTVVCDVDDVLWPLNVTVTNKLGIPLAKLVDFRTADNPLLSPAEHAAITAAYNDPSIFEHMQFFQGVERLLGIEELGVKFELRSNCYNPDIADFKHQNILRAMPGIREDQVYCNVINPQKTGQKTLPQNLLILVDDSPYTVAHSHAKVNVLPQMPYNGTEKAYAMMHGKNLCFVRPGDMTQLADILEMLIIRLLGDYGLVPSPYDQD